MEAQVVPTTLLPGGVEPLWGIRDVMRYLGFGYTKTWRLIHEYGLPYHKIGEETSPLRFDPVEVRAWVARYKDVPRFQRRAS